MEKGSSLRDGKMEDTVCWESLPPTPNKRYSRIDLTGDLTYTDCSTGELTNQYSTYLCFTVKHRTNKLVHYKTDNYSE